MDANQVPDITTMTLDEAKALILDAARRPSESHDLQLGPILTRLMEAAEKRRQAAELMSGSNTRRFYGSDDHPAAPSTAIVYDAVWELVREGLLRPGPRYFGVLNERPDGFALTGEGRKKLKLPS